MSFGFIRVLIFSFLHYVGKLFQIFSYFYYKLVVFIAKKSGFFVEFCIENEVHVYLAGTALAANLSFIFSILALFLRVCSISDLIYFILSANSVSTSDSDCLALCVSEISMFSIFAIYISVSYRLLHDISIIMNYRIYKINYYL